MINTKGEVTCYLASSHQAFSGTSRDLHYDSAPANKPRPTGRWCGTCAGLASQINLTLSVLGPGPDLPMYCVLARLFTLLGFSREAGKLARSNARLQFFYEPKARTA